jgi:hypothetical protein
MLFPYLWSTLYLNWADPSRLLIFMVPSKIPPLYTDFWSVLLRVQILYFNWTIYILNFPDFLTPLHTFPSRYIILNAMIFPISSLLPRHRNTWKNHFSSVDWKTEKRILIISKILISVFSAADITPQKWFLIFFLINSYIPTIKFCKIITLSYS